MNEARVRIWKNETIEDTLSRYAREIFDNYDLMTGAATWTSAKPIDLTASYTAQVVIDDFETEREPIPMSFLIPEYQTTIQVQPEGPLVEARRDTALRVRAGGECSASRLQSAGRSG